MFDSRKPVFGADLPTPITEAAIVDLNHLPTFAADQVVVVSMTAGAVSRLATRPTDRVDRTVLGKPAEVAIDGRQPDLVEPLVQLLRCQRRVGRAERIDDRRLLRGGAALSLRAVSRLIDNDSRFYYAGADEASCRP